MVAKTWTLLKNAALIFMFSVVCLGLAKDCILLAVKIEVLRQHVRHAVVDNIYQSIGD